MREYTVEDLLETCLQRYHSGAELNDILADYPEQAEELQRLITGAIEVYELADQIQVPVAAQSLSRAKFLTAAAQYSARPLPRRFSIFHLRLASSILIAAVIFMAGLTVTGIASAAALPGDVLYPVKRMVEQIQINIAQDQPARLVLEENFDNRRVAEVSKLNQIQRREYVTFSGFLNNEGTGRWSVDHLILDFPAGSISPSDMVGKYVQVSGFSDSRVVTVEEIQLRNFQWDGILQKIDANQWVVSGMNIWLDDQSQIDGESPEVGARVRVNMVRIADNRFLAVTAAVIGLPTSTYPVEKGEGSSRTPVSGSLMHTPEPTQKHEVEKTSTRTPKDDPRPTVSPTRRSEEEGNRTPTRQSVTSWPNPTRRATEGREPTHESDSDH